MCMPPICADIGLSLVTIIEFTTNQSRNPSGKGISLPADCAETAPTAIKTPARARMRRDLRGIDAPPRVRSGTAKKLTPRHFSVNLKCQCNGSLDSLTHQIQP